MPAPTLEQELVAFGPTARQPPLSLAQAEAYCRRLARSHYENFTVASWLLPRALRQPFCNLYAYCRWADDLADETGDPARSLQLLDWWEAQLRRCLAGEAEHPVFIALRPTIERYAIPAEPLQDLLVAFRRDQAQTRYRTRGELLDYCRYSANPVGRLVLCLGEARDSETTRLADRVCTGLQLANHWQDVAQDYARGRIYLPIEALEQFKVTEAMLGARTASAQLRALLQAEVAQAEDLLRSGLALPARVGRDLALPVDLFVRGGLAICAQMRRLGYDTLGQRPRIRRGHKARLLAGAWWRNRLRFVGVGND